MRCQAVTQTKRTCQIEWIALCQNRAIHTIDGVGLCGTHLNAVHDKDIRITRLMFKREDD